MKKPANPSLPLPAGLRRLLPNNPSADQKPQIQSVQLDAHLAGSPRQWLSALSDAGFSTAKLQANTLELAAVQSLDMHGQPHEYVQITLAPRHISLAYTSLPGQRPERRRLEAARLLLFTLRALPNALGSPSSHSASSASLGAWLSASLEQALASVSDSTEQLLHQKSLLEDDNRQLRTRLSSLSAQREADARALLSKTQELEALQARLLRLTTLPDFALDEEVMDWLRSHDGQIRPRELAAVHQVPPSRIEESLDRLSKNGRIART